MFRFRGGADSTVLLWLTRKLFNDVKAVYVDTGLEFPELRQFVKTVDNVEWLKPKMNFKKVIEEYGYPVISKNVSRAIGDVKKHGEGCWFARAFNGEEHGLYDYRKYKYLIEAPFKVSNKCCDIMKKDPLHRFEKETGLKPIIGTMASESLQRRNAWLKTGCNAFEAKNPKSLPLSPWFKRDILHCILRYNIPYCDVIYGEINGFLKGKQIPREQLMDYINNDNLPPEIELKSSINNRTGCVYCLYGIHLEKEPNRIQKLKETHPKLYEYCLREVENGGVGLKQVLDYINVKY